MVIEPSTILFVAAVVGILHMSAPDHWVTLAILGRTSGWTVSKLISVSLVTAIGHVLLSVLMGLAVAGLGFLFSTRMSSYFTAAIGILMVGAGLYVGIKSLISQDRTQNADSAKLPQEVTARARAHGG